ncbi:flavin reductase [Chelativorans sp. J32]|uniref:flavin reductase n=1 Tax=Chelativorans sp. J32 TaxID=935840 RepID=UPI000484D0F0|nr:flavin reductase [Chelativorans sp. J32]
MKDSKIPELLEQGNPAEDPKKFRRTLGQFATGVTAITTATPEGPVGVTANSFSSLSLDPPLVLWSIARTSRSFEAFRNSSHFAVSILAENQIDVSQKLSSSSEDKFSDLEWNAGIGGSPIIAGALATIECVTETIHDGGDHIILVGRVLHHRRFAGKPLLYAQGQYGVVDEHPAFRAADSIVTPTEHGQSLEEQPLTTLLYLAHHYSSAAFDRHRREENISLAQSRILSELKRHPRLSKQALTDRVYLTEEKVADALAQLSERSHVETDSAGLLSLTESGHALARSIRRRVAAYEAEQFAGIPVERLAITRDVLIRFIDGLANPNETDHAA